jgi:uncharacterized protein
MKILIVPGYTASGAHHWQTVWERRAPSMERVVQRDWDQPVREDWVDTLDRAVLRSDGPVVFVAHSLGCATVAHWFGVRPEPSPVVGALLVAPADVDQPGWPAQVQGFRPMPLSRLPARTIVVASRNDPWVSFERAHEFSEAWGSRLEDAGLLGHIDSNSALGAWSFGLQLLNGLLDGCGLDQLSV